MEALIFLYQTGKDPIRFDIHAMHLNSFLTLQWKDDLEQILNMATHDTDQWVSMIGEILHTYPSTGSLNLELDNIPTFCEILSDLNKVGKYTLTIFCYSM